MNWVLPCAVIRRGYGKKISANHQQQVRLHMYNVTSSRVFLQQTIHPQE